MEPVSEQTPPAAATSTRPTITTTLGRLAVAEPALARLAAQPAPSKTAYHVAKLVKLVGAELAFFGERRNALIKELGEERPATPNEQSMGQPGPVVQVKPEHLATFHARHKELADVEVTIPWGPVDLAAFGEVMQITAADINDLGELLTG